MERSSESVEGCGKGEERIRKSRADKFACMCGDVTSFMITVIRAVIDGKISGVIKNMYLWIVI